MVLESYVYPELVHVAEFLLLPSLQPISAVQAAEFLSVPSLQPTSTAKHVADLFDREAILELKERLNKGGALKR